MIKVYNQPTQIHHFCHN